MDSTLVVGVGNILLRDEGVGVHAVNYLRGLDFDQSNIEFLDGGTLGFSLVSYIHKNLNLIIVDAMQLNATAGSVAYYVGSQMQSYLQNSASSVHEIGIVDLLQIAGLNDSLPKQQAIIGIQPGCLEWGEHLTPQVLNSLPQIARIVQGLVELWSANGKPSMRTANSIKPRHHPTSLQKKIDGKLSFSDHYQQEVRQ